MLLDERALVGLPDDVRERAAAIRALVLDVDGVLTDGSLEYGADGETTKTFHVKDGLGIRLCARERIAVAVISAKTSAPLRRRLEDLRVPHAMLGREDKSEALDEVMGALGITEREVAFVGDDLLDLPILRRVGLAIAPADAHPLVLSEVAWVTRALGGRGAVREVCDGLLAARGRLRASCEDLLATRSEKEKKW